MSGTYDITEFENILSLDNPIRSSIATRWERKSKNGGGNSSFNANTSQRSILADMSADCNVGGEMSMDRFIPNRMATIDLNQSLSENGNDVEQTDYTKLLLEANGSSSKPPARVLAFKNKAPAPKDEHVSSLKVLYSVQGAKKTDVAVKPSRHISSTSARILDAPDLRDDYYLNLLSWSSTNVLAVALSQSVYLWNSDGSVKELMTLDNSDDYVSSVSWIQQGGSHIAIGTANNAVQLWDVAAGKLLRTMNGHTSRVGALAWNEHLLTSGSRDTTVVNHDVRVQNHIVGRMTSHSLEVCGLAWSPDGSTLATGSNDNKLCIYDASATQSLNAQPKFVLSEHQAAVKALAWSPHERNLLASGGGTADRSIKFWNTASGSLLNSIDTGSQVCALQWSPYEKEILSSHGYAENQLCLWKYPSMAKMKELRGHTSRVLHLATSPVSGMVCSAAGDETMRFWNVFSSEGKRKGDPVAASGSLSRSTKLCIR